MRIIVILIIALITLPLSQCTSYDFARRVTRQGNLLPQDAIARLKPGMTKEDVSILLGTSLISTSFNDNRWDYAYTWRRGTGAILKKTVTLYFSRDRLVRIEQKL